MKIKLDFITNSSSTAYVVMMPDDFNIHNALFKCKDSYSYQDDLCDYDDDKPKVIEYISEGISKLMAGQDLWNDDTPCFNTIQEIVEKEDLIIASVDISSDSGGMLISADKSKIKKLLTRCTDES